jgi:hypothetical protein
MKKLRLLTFSGVVFVTLSITSCGKNTSNNVMCPPIPEKANFLTLKEDSAHIFLEKTSQKTITKLSKGYRLNPLNQTAQKTEESEIGNCKYQAELTSDIKENLPQNNNIAQDKNLPQNNNITQGSFWIEKKYLEDFPNNNFSLQLLLSLVLSIIQTLIVIVLFIIIRDINANQKRSVQKIKETINQSYNQLLNQISTKNDSKLDSYYKRAKVKFKGISDQIIDLKQSNSSALSQTKSFSDSHPVGNDYPSLQINTSSYPENVFPSGINGPVPTFKREIDEIIENFNDQKKDYFDSRFQPLGLTKSSSQGLVGEDGNRIIQLESFNDISKDLFLQIMLDGENWLIPNAASSFVGQILNRLEEYPEIFSVVESGKNKLTLIKPAKLKNVGSGLWEIAEIGEFEK